MADLKCLRIVLVLLFGATAARGGKFYCYVGQIESTSVLIAWGTTDGVNTIGRTSSSMGQATVSIAGQTLKTDKNWIMVNGLEPDKEFAYAVSVNTNRGAGNVRTYPEHATHLRFFVIGDYGTGLDPQREIASAMAREFERLSALKDPPRFVITTGDNIYADLNLGLKAVHSGDSDTDWDSKFFGPYQALLREIPFYPSPGNHDGNGSENRDDLPAYLDNFFFPHNQPARWYSFRFADLAEFFSLDSTTNTASGRPKPQYLASGEQFHWFKSAVEASKVPWKIPYFHHPPFNAGPFHGASLKELSAFCQEFAAAGVKVVFSGHEHNFQFSENDAATSGIEYVVSGAGGELRPGNVRKKMRAAHIAGWAPEHHFLSVEINGSEMKITPIGSAGTLAPENPNGSKITMPVVVNR